MHIVQTGLQKSSINSSSEKGKMRVFILDSLMSLSNTLSR